MAHPLNFLDRVFGQREVATGADRQLRMVFVACADDNLIFVGQAKRRAELVVEGDVGDVGQTDADAVVDQPPAIVAPARVVDQQGAVGLVAAGGIGDDDVVGFAVGADAVLQCRRCGRHGIVGQSLVVDNHGDADDDGHGDGDEERHHAKAETAAQNDGCHDEHRNGISDFLVHCFGKVICYEKGENYQPRLSREDLRHRPAYPCLRGCQSEDVGNRGRHVVLHHGIGHLEASADAFAVDDEGREHLVERLSAVSLTGAAVVGGEHNDGVVHHAGIADGLNDAGDTFVEHGLKGIVVGGVPALVVPLFVKSAEIEEEECGLLRLDVVDGTLCVFVGVAAVLATVNAVAAVIGVHDVVDGQRVEDIPDAVPVELRCGLGRGALLLENGEDGREDAVAVGHRRRNLRPLAVPFRVAVALGARSHEVRGPVDGRCRREHGAFLQCPAAVFHQKILHGGHIGIGDALRGPAVDADHDDVLGSGLNLTFGLNRRGHQGEQ